jgi:hypothetical protein
MKRIVSFFAVATALALASTASAQVQTGSILVRAQDEQGAVMPGVSITISSPVLVSGSMTGVTDAGGVNRFPSLVPGTYTVKLELSGFSPSFGEHRRPGRSDDAGGIRDGGDGGNITVTGASPTVDTTTQRQRQSQSGPDPGTPGGRDIWGLLEARCRASCSRPDVGGTSGGLQGTFSARGTTSAQNTSFLNGVNVGDPAAIGSRLLLTSAFDDIRCRPDRTTSPCRPRASS